MCPGRTNSKGKKAMKNDNDSPVPADDCDMIGQDILEHLAEVNVDQEKLQALVGSMEEREPEFTEWIRTTAKNHLNVLKRSLNKNGTKAVETLCVKFTAMAFYAVITGLSIREIEELKLSLNGQLDETDNT